jgi:hypothetical protein
MMNLSAPQVYPYLLGGCAEYYFREWNAAHTGPEQLVAIEIVYMMEETRPPGEERPPVKPITLFRYPPPPPEKK